MEAIECKRLTKRYGARTAVDALDLTIHRGECFALLGQNGAGKTTTLRMLCCLTAPSGGDALLLGDSILHRVEIVKQKINVSPQETAVAPKLSVQENLVLMARLYGSGKEQAARKAEAMMAAFSLSDRKNSRAKTLSGGLQRRLSIAMALISEPELLFLDEPTLGLDVRARRGLWNLVERLKGDMTIVLTTHYLEEAQALADRIGILQNGRLAALGTVEQIERQTGTRSLEEAFLSLTEEDAACG